MFLTQKGLRKIILMVVCYFAIGTFCMAMGTMPVALGADAKFAFVLGTFCYFMCPIIIAWGRYAEGKGKWIDLGNKLVRSELKPTEFIKEYQCLRNSAELAVNKPCIEVLQAVAIAYDALGDRENCLAVADEMILLASSKKKMFAKLTKCSFLFSYGMIDEAESILDEARACKLNLICVALMDTILKCDRAKAVGDYKTAEAYHLKMLTQTFPKLDNLAKLVLHFNLGEIYEKLQDNEKAFSYYKYCVDNGGETAIKEAAGSALQRIPAP